MIKSFFDFYKQVDKIIFYAASLSIFTAFIISLTFLLTHSSLPQTLPLFYSLPWGAQELVTTNQLLILPAIILLITLLNLIVSWHLHSSQLILKRILNLTSTMLALLLLITALKIVFIFI